MEQLTALGEVGRALSSTLDLETVLNTIVARANELAGTDACSVYEYDEAVRGVPLPRHRQPRRGDGRGGPSDTDPEAAKASWDGWWSPVSQCRSLTSARNEAYRGPLRDILLRTGTRAVLAIPLLREEHLIGGLTVSRKAPGEFPPETIDLLKTFATQSALAIQNARLFREIEDKSRQLETASKHKSQFLANMSHELRTPLNAILGYTELIADKIYGEVPEKMREVLERVEKSGRHLLGLINDILDLSKIEAGQLTLALDRLLDGRRRAERRGLRRGAGREKKLELAVTVDPDLPLGHGDQRRLTQVVLNLVGNALKFTDAGHVAVRASRADDAFLVAVADTGPGIAPDDQAKIFEEFQQAESASHAGQGRHRARVGHRPPHHRDARGAAVGGVHPGTGVDLLVHRAHHRVVSKRILAVDDQEDNRRILRDLLTSAGYEVIEATTGEEAVALAEAQVPDLILMDIQLPGIDGYEATRRIKANPRLRQIPLIVVTSYALSGDDAKAFSAGADAYVSKPFSPRALLGKVREFLG